jgi:nucleoporin GLE1
MGYIEKKEGDQTRLETETEFLNRMSGLIRLFCKLLVRRGPPFDNNLSYAWRWISDVLNLPPIPNITAVLLRVFLDEAGGSMIKEYPTQFPKIIQSIQIQYIPKLVKETGHDQISRLGLTLEALKKKC